MYITFIVVVFAVAILDLSTTQCSKKNNRIRAEFFEDGQILETSSPTLNKKVGESFIIGCRKCNTNRGLPRWQFNGTEIPRCNNTNDSVCTKVNENDSLILDLCFRSLTESLATVYKCTIHELNITIEPG